jgi:two-component system, response regulator PdtaR
MPTVLIVEDDLLISDLIEDVLVGAGYEVSGVARTAAEAIALGLRHKPDLAVIDVRLADGSDGTVAAARLMDQFTLGVLYATGNPEYVFASRAPGHACLKKPYRPGDIVRALKVIEQIVATGEPPRTLPHGLLLLQQHPVTGDR